MVEPIFTPRPRSVRTTSSVPGISSEYSDRQSSCSGTKSANIRSTSFSPGGRPCRAVQRAFTPSSSVTFWMCTRLWAPIGARASSMEMGTPARSNTFTNTTAGAMHPKSIVVPAQSSSAAWIGPR